MVRRVSLSSGFKNWSVLYLQLSPIYASSFRRWGSRGRREKKVEVVSGLVAKVVVVMVVVVVVVVVVVTEAVEEDEELVSNWN